MGSHGSRTVGTENVKPSGTIRIQFQSPRVFLPRVDRNYRKAFGESLRLNESHVSIFFFFLIYDNLATRISEAAKRERR